MFRGYRCINKDAKTILVTLGFDPNVNRGWIILRRNPTKNTPCRMHALINTDTDKVQYIDIHSDFEVDGKHVTKRGRRTERWNQLFRQIDYDDVCDAGHRLLTHYVGLKNALLTYHEERYQNAERKEG